VLLVLAAAWLVVRSSATPLSLDRLIARKGSTPSWPAPL